MRWISRKLPVARNEGLLIEHVGDEIVAYDSATKEAHCLTPLAAAVFSLCDGQTDAAGMARQASERLGEPFDTERVLDALSQLEERHLLESGGVSRRDVLRKGAVAGGVVVAAPLISSVFAPPALASASHTCANLLCCPCTTSSTQNANDCCYIKNVTQNCQCVNASAPSDPRKWCKPTGPAPDDLFCEQHQPPFSECSQATSFPAGGCSAA